MCCNLWRQTTQVRPSIAPIARLGGDALPIPLRRDTLSEKALALTRVFPWAMMTNESRRFG
jgi:hypothetical protein